MNMANYEEFLKTVTPTVLSLTSSGTKYERKDYFRMRNSPILRHVSARYELSDVRPDYFDVLATFEFALRVIESRDIPKSGLPLISIACTFEGHFHASEIEKQHAEQFAQKDAWLIFWPYFRQFVSDVTARMSIRPELLPLGLGPGAYSATSAQRLAGPPPKQVEAKTKTTAPKKKRGR